MVVQLNENGDYMCGFTLFVSSLGSIDQYTKYIVINDSRGEKLMEIKIKILTSHVLIFTAHTQTHTHTHTHTRNERA